MMLMTSKVRHVVFMAAILATSVSSSFVPRTSLVRLSHSQRSHNFMSLSGGSEEENDVEQGRPSMTPPAPVPEPLQQASAVEIVGDATTMASDAASQTENLGPKAAPPGFLRKTFPSLPWHQLPNYLTYVRCLAIPALIYIFYQPNMNVVAGVLFAIASFTDWLDGFLARRWDITSPFGAFLDPVADKLMVSTSLILLAGRYGAKVAIPAAIILAREISVSALREWMAQRGQRDIVKVGFQGKVKTALTMVSLTVLLFVPFPIADGFLSNLFLPGIIMLYLSSVVTITSGSVYFLAAAPLLREENS